MILLYKYKLIINTNNNTNKIRFEFIDTEEFQRLRNLRQLGVCHYVFSGANHT